MVDATIFRLQRRSFLSERRRALAAMMFWSVPFWFFFELYNLFLKNWYYVFVLRSPWAQGLAALLDFATVLPACFLHAELVQALGWWREKPSPPLPPREGPSEGSSKARSPSHHVAPEIETFCLILGALSILAPLLWPRYAFWMVWWIPLWIPEVVNHRVGAPSLLSDWEAGRAERLMRLLAGGLWAGIVWELLNFWARSKWIYSVPGFEGWKLLEMPLLGFLGFPVLALAAFSSYSMLSHFLRGGRDWERPDSQAARPIRPVRYAVAAALALAVSLAVLCSTVRITVASVRPVLEELGGLDRDSIRKLRSVGIPTPERLDRAFRKEGWMALASRTGIARDRLGRAETHAALALHKGMGTEAARLLISAGIYGVKDLGAVDPEQLMRYWRERADQSKQPLPRLSEVRVWVQAAKGRTIPRH